MTGRQLCSIKTNSVFFYFRLFVDVADADKRTYANAMYILEVCLLDIQLVKVPASLLAAAALWLALNMKKNDSPLGKPDTNGHAVWSEALMDYTKYLPGDMDAVLPRMKMNLILMDRKHELQSTRQKYVSGMFVKVSKKLLGVKNVEELRRHGWCSELQRPTGKLARMAAKLI